MAIGVECSAAKTLKLSAWQDTLNLLHSIPLPATNSSFEKGTHHVIRLRIDVELVLAQVWFAIDGSGWSALPAFHESTGSEMTFEYVSTLMAWQAVGPDKASWDQVQKQAPTDAFTTLHPGVFAGSNTSTRPHTVFFDYFHYTDNEVWPVNEV